MKFSQHNRARLQAPGFTVVVTGATGWLGQAALEMLAETYGAQFPDRVRAFASGTHIITLRGGQDIACHPLPAICDLPPGRYLFLHFAFLGKERTAELSLNDYALRVAEITEMMDSAMRRITNLGIVLPSSGAVYRADHTFDNDLEGNPYGVLKRRDEVHFTRLAEILRVPITIPRIFNLSGPYINKLGSYALSSILSDILNGRPVRLQAPHPVIRSYVHVADVLDVALRCQFAESEGNLTFDTVGEIEIEIGELARMAVDILGRPDHPILRPPVQFQPINRYVGNSDVFNSLLNAFGCVALRLASQIEDTTEFLRGILPYG